MALMDVDMPTPFTPECERNGISIVATNKLDALTATSETCISEEPKQSI